MSSDLTDFGGGAPDPADVDQDDEQRDRADSPHTDPCDDCGEHHVGVHERDAVAPGLQLCPSCALARLGGEPT